MVLGFKASERKCRQGKANGSSEVVRQETDATIFGYQGGIKREFKFLEEKRKP